jgi:hypothetical protein
VGAWAIPGHAAGLQLAMGSVSAEIAFPADHAATVTGEVRVGFIWRDINGFIELSVPPVVEQGVKGVVPFALEAVLDDTFTLHNLSALPNLPRVSAYPTEVLCACALRG